MLGNFTFHNPTKLYFGENSLENLGKELGKYGEKVMLVYGGGSIPVSYTHLTLPTIRLV